MEVLLVLTGTPTCAPKSTTGISPFLVRYLESISAVPKLGIWSNGMVALYGPNMLLLLLEHELAPVGLRCLNGFLLLSSRLRIVVIFLEFDIRIMRFPSLRFNVSAWKGWRAQSIIILQGRRIGRALLLFLHDFFSFLFTR